MNTTSLAVRGRSTAQIDAATAAILLGTLARPSKVRAANVSRYARLMTAERWVPEVATLTFDETGALIDGASVLRAVIASDTTITVTLQTGVPFHMAAVTGIGRGQTLADRIRGDFTRPEMVANVIHLQLRAQDGHDALLTPRKAHILDGVAYASANNDVLEDATVRAHRLLEDIHGVLPRHLAWVVYQAVRISPADATAFFNRLAEGVLLEAGSPVHQLHMYLRRVRRPRDEQRKTVGMLVKCWNAYRSGSEGRITFRAGGHDPEVIPALV